MAWARKKSVGSASGWLVLQVLQVAGQDEPYLAVVLIWFVS